MLPSRGMETNEGQEKSWRIIVLRTTSTLTPTEGHVRHLFHSHYNNTRPIVVKMTQISARSLL